MKRNYYAVFVLAPLCLIGIYSCKKDVFHSVISENNLSNMALPPSEREYHQGPTQGVVAAQLGLRGQHNDMQATGFYVAPGDSITVTVTQTSGTILPVLAVGT